MNNPFLYEETFTEDDSKTFHAKSFNQEYGNKKDDINGYYKILDLEIGADSEAIKNAFRKKAKELHPDHNKAPEATAMFKLLSEANQVLSDPLLRGFYNLAATAPYINSDTHNFFINFHACSCCGAITDEIRITKYQHNIGMVFGCETVNQENVLCYDCAKKIALKATLKTLLMGWWAIPCGITKSVACIWKNIKGGEQDKSKNLELLSQQTMAFITAKNEEQALKSAKHALTFAVNKIEQDALNNIIIELDKNQKSCSSSKWQKPPAFYNQVSLSLLFAILITLIISLSSSLLFKSAPEENFDSMFSQLDSSISEENQEIDTYNDSISKKVLSFQINLYDENMLFHTIENKTKVMYSAGYDYDMITMLDEQTTVRITGIVPKSSWVQIMMADGIIGFTEKRFLKKGRGTKKIPVGAAIIAEQPVSAPSLNK